MLPKFHIEIEKWKYNTELELYVSSNGKIKNKFKQDIIPCVNQQGYLIVCVFNKVYLVHRIVMMTFRPVANYHNLTVDHLDHNKRNNSLNNLEWVDFIENQRRSQHDYITNNQIPSNYAEYGNESVSQKTTLIGHGICFGSHIVKTCMEAAKLINEEQKLKLTKQDLEKLSTQIGQVANTDSNLYGYTFIKK